MSWATSRPEVSPCDVDATGGWRGGNVGVDGGCRLQDWHLGGKCDVYLWGAGRHGQLAEAGRNILVPTTAPSFSQAQQVQTPDAPTSSWRTVLTSKPECGLPPPPPPPQVVCGQNCTFVIQPNGTVLACGEGSYGRLGQGNSDDLHVLTVISALQGDTFVLAAEFPHSSDALTSFPVSW